MEKKKDRKNEREREKHSRGRSQKDGFFVLLEILKMHIAPVPADQRLQTFKRSQNSRLERFHAEIPLWCVSIAHWHAVFTSFMGKGNLKALSPVLKRGCQED